MAAHQAHEKLPPSEHDQTGNGGAFTRQLSVSLTNEQFEKLYLQPGGTQSRRSFARYFGNPTSIGLIGFNVCLWPVSMYLMGFGTSDTASNMAIFGAFTYLGGLVQLLAGIMEFIIGNTFPSIVFFSFGGFWLAFGVINQPAQDIAAAFTADGGTVSPFYAALAIYLTGWGIVILIYLLASLRTNMVFVFVFLVLDIGVWLLSAAYFRLSQGGNAASLLVASGAFNFATCCGTWYLILVNVFASTGMPIKLPVGDLSGFLAGPDSRKSR